MGVGRVPDPAQRRSGQHPAIPDDHRRQQRGHGVECGRETGVLRRISRVVEQEIHGHAARDASGGGHDIGFQTAIVGIVDDLHLED